MKLTNSINAAKAVLTICLLALGLSRAAAHVDPSTTANVDKSQLSTDYTAPCIFTTDK